MRKDEIKKAIISIGKQENTITGIHNYCDRWCERCAFTSRCASFALSEKINLFDAETDLLNKEFWDDYTAMMQATIELLIESMEKFGITADELKELVEESEREVPNAKFVSEAKVLGHKIFKWLQQNSDEFEKLGWNVSDAKMKKNIVFDALDVVNWYCFFIASKIERASSSIGNDDMKSEMNGSAKVALISVERSMTAFTILHEKLTKHEDEILEFLIQLSSIKKTLLASFPDAQTFIRPGLDE
ncbi:MAG: hypothetical protein CVU05_11750 [Bacteroidetes bacterium HGW-Bacteroidetes-21]|nr:MAG: hypothetical protein CVU05_11750 [Bacteroidetes bacterium HGW-Bacteroidetes-21]